MPSSEASRLLQAEIAADAARQEIARREFARHRGVSWAGMTPDPPRPQPIEALQARARARLAARQAWRASDDGLLLTAVADCQAAARGAYVTAERARAGMGRGEDAEWRRQVLEDLAQHARALAAGLRQARRALEDA